MEQVRESAVASEKGELKEMELKEIRSLQTYNEGNKVYVITYYEDDSVMVKMYERNMGDVYNYIGMIEMVAQGQYQSSSVKKLLILDVLDLDDPELFLELSEDDGPKLMKSERGLLVNVLGFALAVTFGFVTEIPGLGIGSLTASG